MILALLGSLHADPCGMVFPPPPPELKRSGGRTLEREGAQRTWVSFADGVETLVLRPGFKGRVDEFGMLIPFPSPPTIRKVDENVFAHIEAAVDPPAMTVDVQYPRRGSGLRSAFTRSACSAKRLWVGDGEGATPRPGMRDADTTLRAGASFDGFVQAMGFRFEVDEPVVPMRLSVFNGEAPRNVLYMLTDTPVAILDLDPDLVVRQVDGTELFDHLEDPIPLWFRQGQRRDVAPATLALFDEQRRPERYSAVARELIASDLLAFETGELELGFEAAQTELLNISEALGLRGVEIDGRHAELVAEQRDEALDAALMRIDGFTLSVLDGFFDPEVLARQNLGFVPYEMDAARNTRRMERIRPLGPIVSVPAFTGPGVIGVFGFGGGFGGF